METTEKNGELDFGSKDNKSPSKTTISTTIGVDIWNLAKREGISWSDALDFGIRFLVADKNEMDWPDDTKLWEKFQKVIKQRNALQMEVNGLREQVEDVTEEEIEQEADNILNAEVKKDEWL